MEKSTKSWVYAVPLLALSLLMRTPKRKVGRLTLRVELGAAPVRGHHLGTVELTDSCTLQVRVGAAIDMLGRGRAVRGRESCTQSQKSWFQALPNVLSGRLASPI